MNKQEELLMWKRYGKTENEIPKKCLLKHDWSDYSTWYHRINDEQACTYTKQCRKCGIYDKVQYHKPRERETVVDQWQT